MLLPTHPHLSYAVTNDSDPTASAGTGVTSGAANTYTTTPVQIHAGFTYATNFVQVNITNTGSNNSNRNTYVDIGIGPNSGAVTWIAEKLGGPGAAPGIGHTFFMPLRIPPDTPIWARHQNVTSTITAGVQITAQGGNMNPGTLPHMDRIVPLGATAASTVGTTLTVGASGAEGGWQEIVASSSEDYAGFMVGFFNTGTAHTAASVYSFDVGIGGSGSEISIGENVTKTIVASSSEQFCSVALPTFIGIPAGSRISVRGSCTTAVVTTSSVIVYGFMH